MWLELHKLAVDLKRGTFRGDVMERLHFWSEGMPPADECPCRKEWADILEIEIPPVDSPDDFFWWTVAAHDRINVLLDREIWHPKSRLSPLILTLEQKSDD